MNRLQRVELEQQRLFVRNWGSDMPVTSLLEGVDIIRRDASIRYWPDYLLPRGWVLVSLDGMQAPETTVCSERGYHFHIIVG